MSKPTVLRTSEICRNPEEEGPLLGPLPQDCVRSGCCFGSRLSGRKLNTMKLGRHLRAASRYLSSSVPLLRGEEEGGSSGSGAALALLTGPSLVLCDCQAARLQHLFAYQLISRAIRDSTHVPPLSHFVRSHGHQASSGSAQQTLQRGRGPGKTLSILPAVLSLLPCILVCRPRLTRAGSRLEQIACPQPQWMQPQQQADKGRNALSDVTNNGATADLPAKVRRFERALLGLSHSPPSGARWTQACVQGRVMRYATANEQEVCSWMMQSCSVPIELRLSPNLLAG